MTLKYRTKLFWVIVSDAPFNLCWVWWSWKMTYDDAFCDGEQEGLTPRELFEEVEYYYHHQSTT